LPSSSRSSSSSGRVSSTKTSGYEVPPHSSSGSGSNLPSSSHRLSSKTSLSSKIPVSVTSITFSEYFNQQVEWRSITERGIF
jgi:hypothetical protein